MGANIAKGVYSIAELAAIGYPTDMMRKLLKCEDFPKFGFRIGKSRNSKAFFYKEKLDNYLKHMTEVNQ